MSITMTSVWFDYDRFFETHPTVTKIVRVLEWFYIPAHDLIMHGVMIFTSFIIPQRRDQRVRNVAVILIRGGIYTALLIYFPKVAILYAAGLSAHDAGSAFHGQRAT